MRRALICLPLVTGCYAYVPIETALLRPGMSVRARVSGATADQIEPLLGIPNARLLRGTLIATGPDTLIVEVPAVLRAEVGSSLQTLYQRVSIPRSGVLELEARTPDRFKTYAVAVGVTAIVAALVLKYAIINPGKENLPGGGGPADFRIPMFHFRR